MISDQDTKTICILFLDSRYRRSDEDLMIWFQFLDDRDTSDGLFSCFFPQFHNHNLILNDLMCFFEF